MGKRPGTIQRVGRIYRFAANGNEYAAFIWRDGSQFRGRVEGQPDMAPCTGRTAIAVRDTLRDALLLKLN